MQFQKEPGGVSKVLSHRDALIDVITCDVLTKTTIFIWGSIPSILGFACLSQAKVGVKSINGTRIRIKHKN